MNEEISVTLRNNTNQIQPVSLFTEIFAIPSNMTGGSTNIYSWDLSNESFNYGFNSAIANIQVSTSPITQSTPTTSTGTFPTNDISGLVSELNLLGVGTFTNVGNVLYVTSNNYYFGQLILSAEFYISVTSGTPNVPPAIQLYSNGNLLLTIPSGSNANVVNAGSVTSGDNIQVNVTVGAGATSWLVLIQNYLPPPALPINIFNISGAGAYTNSFSFTYPQQGNILIILGITP